MRRMTTLFGLLALVAASAVTAQQERERQQTRPEQKAEKTFMGEVASIDVDEKTLTVEEMSSARPPSRIDPTEPPSPEPEVAVKSMTFHIDAQTEVTTEPVLSPEPPRQDPLRPEQEEPRSEPPRPGTGADARETLELEDLKEGDRVSVKYVESGGKNQAKSIEVIRRGTTS